MVSEEKESLAVGSPHGARSTGPGEGMVGFGTAERTKVCSSSIRMGACNEHGSTDVVINTELFAVGGTENTVDDPCPSLLTVGKLCWCGAIAVVFADGVIKFTT